MQEPSEIGRCREVKEIVGLSKDLTIRHIGSIEANILFKQNNKIGPQNKRLSHESMLYWLMSRDALISHQ